MALLHVNYQSDVLGMQSSMDVILPQHSWKDSQAMRHSDSLEPRYPVLYLLHGMSDDHTIWQRRTAVERYAMFRNIAIVMPDGHLSWYVDMKHGGKYYTYLTEELPAIVRDLFPRVSDKREDTYIAGLSMGGYGALRVGLGAPERYSLVASLSGAVDMRIHSWGNPEYWNDVFGTPEEFKDSDNDLIALAGRSAAMGIKPDIYMWCGLQDGLLPMNHNMKARLEELDYDLTYSESDGNHGWQWWDDQIELVLNWIDAKRNAKN